jgi:malonate-semialdehyde dehydrogenase (acetylating)/methylmalonate-semialdehyde dehydrogenase
MQNQEHTMVRDISPLIGGSEIPAARKSNGGAGARSSIRRPGRQARVPLASAHEVRAAIADAEAAQPEWAATNPQKRARVLMRFLELLRDETDELAALLSSEHGKTLDDAKGDIQRGVEVIEFCIGARTC